MEAINLCVLCVSVVPSTRSCVASALRSPAGLYLRIHFTHQIQESLTIIISFLFVIKFNIF
nr:hypothetical protein [Microcystis aeruginosa]